MMSLRVLAVVILVSSAAACARGAASDLSERDDPLTQPSASRPEPSDTAPPPPLGVEGPRDGAADEGARPDGGSPTGTTFSGVAAGVTIQPAHAAAIVVPGASGPDRIVIAVTTRAGFCADYAAGIDHAGEKTLVLAVLSASGAAVGPGTYPIGRGRPSSIGGSFDTSARILAYDAQCRTTIAAADELASSGTVSLTHIGAAAHGTFSLDFPGGGTVTGTLDAPVCTSPGADSFTCSP